MKTVPPKFSVTELQYILDGEIIIPGHVSETFIATELMNNSQLSWTLNPYLLKGELLKLFTDTTASRQWRLFMSLNCAVIGLIAVYALLTQDLKILWTIPLNIVLIYSGILDLWIGISVATIVVGYGLLTNTDNHYFWFTVLIALAGYTLSKLSIKTVERTLINYATADTKTFWKFFSKKLIVATSDKSYAELTRLENENSAIRTE